MVTPSGALAIPSKMNSMQRRRSSHYSLRENSASVFVIGDHVPGPDKYEYGAPSFRDLPPCNERRQQRMEYNEGPSPIPQTSMYAFCATVRSPENVWMHRHQNNDIYLHSNLFHVTIYSPLTHTLWDSVNLPIETLHWDTCIDKNRSDSNQGSDYIAILFFFDFEF